MEQKKCTVCGEVKKSYQFYRNKTVKSGLRSHCIKCAKHRVSIQQRSNDGLLRRIYSNQKLHSKRRGHNPPVYSVTQFIDKYINTIEFITLFDEWVVSGYNKELTPSFDRADDSKGYSFGNLNKWMTWGENNAKSSKDILSGKISHTHKKVSSINSKGYVIDTFVSLHSAGRSINRTSSNIREAIKRNGTSGGVRWMFAQEE